MVRPVRREVIELKSHGPEMVICASSLDFENVSKALSVVSICFM